MVMGLPDWICSANNGITDPRLHMTLPYRVQEITVLPRSAATRALAMTTRSIIALEIPIALMG